MLWGQIPTKLGTQYTLGTKGIAWEGISTLHRGSEGCGTGCIAAGCSPGRGLVDAALGAVLGAGR